MIIEGRHLFTVSIVVAVNEHISVLVSESYVKGYALLKKKNTSWEVFVVFWAFYLQEIIPCHQAGN